MEIRETVRQNAGDDRCNDRSCGVKLHTALVFLQKYQGILCGESAGYAKAYRRYRGGRPGRFCQAVRDGIGAGAGYGGVSGGSGRIFAENGLRAASAHAGYQRPAFEHQAGQ